MKLKSFLATALAALIAFTPMYAPVKAQIVASLLPPGKQCFSATTGISGMVGTIGTIAGGSLYTTGAYGGVPLTGGSGTGATANITVAGGVVSAVTILNPGVQYVVGDVLSASAASIGGTGSGFSFPVASTSINSSLAGGSVAYYIPNTLTTKQTWQNSSESILNQNPVPLDSNGCAIVYGSGTYRQILKDNLGDTVWDVITTAGGSGGGGSGQVALGDNAYVGDIHAFSGIVAPTNYMFAAGQAVSRTTYATLFSIITYSLTLTCSSGGPTISGIADTTQIPIGAPLEISCFAPGSTVISKTSSSVTMSSNATTSASVTGTFFPWGDGDGSTTFNLPNLSGYVMAGRDNLSGSNAGRLTVTYYGSNPDALGAASTSPSGQSVTLVQGNLPNESPTFTGTSNQPVSVTSTVSNIVQGTTQGATSGASFTAALAVNISGVSSTGTFTPSGTISALGSSTPFSIIQPTTTINYIIKVQADTISAGIVGITATLPLTVTATSTGVVNIALNTPLAAGFGGSGSASFTVGLPLLGNGTNPFAQGTLTGNTTRLATSTGTLTTGDCVKIDANGNFVDSGSTGCVSSGGSSSPEYQIFTAPGAVSTLTLTTTPLPTSAGQITAIYFDGSYQLRNTWSINIGTGVITFNGGIPGSVRQVEVDWNYPSTFAGVGSLNSISGAINLLAGTGISLSTVGNNITITNTVPASFAVFNVTSSPYNAVANYNVSLTAAMANSSTTITGLSGLTAANVGNYIAVSCAGATGACPGAGKTLYTTIASVTNSTTAVLTAANASGGNIIGSTAEWGTDQAAAFQAAWNACVAAGGGIVYVPSGDYFLSQLNMTNLSSSCILQGNGADGTLIFPLQVAAYTTKSGHMFDMTGSSFIGLSNFQIGANYTLALPATAIFMAQVASGASNRMSIENVYVSGQFAYTTFYDYGVPSLRTIYNSDFYNYALPFTNTQGSLYLTSSNADSLTSGFATVTTGTQSTSDILFAQCEFHKFDGAAIGSVIYLDGASNITWLSGVVSGGAQYDVSLANALGSLTFHNVTFETESQPEPTFAYLVNSGMTLTSLDDVGSLYITTSGKFSSGVTSTTTVQYSH